MDIAVPILEWLLEDKDPSIRYRTLAELLDRDKDDPDVQQARDAIPAGKDAMRIFSKMHPDGYWLQKYPSTGEMVGDGVRYGAFASTHFCLAYFAELGFDRDHPDVNLAAGRYLDLVQPDGDFMRHFSCLYGYNIRTFILLGYRHDPRLQKSIDLLLRTDRADGGYLCDMHEGKYKSREVKSCIRGCVKALMAFSEMPEYWDHPRCLRLVDYFRVREGIFHSTDLSKPINYDVVRTSFPITWRAGLIEILYAFSKMGYGGESWLSRAWDQLENKRSSDGRYIMDWSPSQSLLKPGKRGEPNKWITLYSLLAKKYAFS